jgi:outer membrane protein
MTLALLALAIPGTACIAQNDSTRVWTLRQCIDYAIEHNITVQQMENATHQNELDVNTAKWARLPNLNGSAGQDWRWGRSASPQSNGYINTQNANSSVSLSTGVPLFTGLQIPYQYALSKLNLKAALEDLKNAKENIAVNIAGAYLQALLNSELQKVAQDQVVLSKEQADRIQGMFKVGKASQAELADALSRVAQDELLATQANNTYRLSILDLSQMLELPTPEGFALVGPQVGIDIQSLTPPDDIYAQALTFKPVVKAAEYRLQGSEKSIRIAQSAFYPQLSFSAGLGTSYYTLSGQGTPSFSTQLKNNFSKYIAFNLSVPLFNRFATRNRVRSARIQKLNYSLDLDNVKKTLYKEIQQAWYNALAAESKYTSSTAAEESSTVAFQLMTEKFENGKANAVEYNESKQNLMKAQSDELQAKYEYLFRTKILDFYKGQAIE